MPKPFLSLFRSWRPFCYRAAHLALLVAVWIEMSPFAWAKPKGQPEAVAAPTKSYVGPYMVVLLFIGLGIVLVCRPSSRAEKFEKKVKDYDDD